MAARRRPLQQRYFLYLSTNFILILDYKKFNRLLNYAVRRVIFPVTHIIQNTAKFTITTLAPAGRFHIKDKYNPARKHISDITAELITTERKLEKIRIELSAGNIIKLDISIVPIIRMPITTVTAVKNAISILYKLTFTPPALEKFSSNVTAKILL